MSRKFEFRILRFEFGLFKLGITHGGKKISKGMKLETGVGSSLLPESGDGFVGIVMPGKQEGRFR